MQDHGGRNGNGHVKLKAEPHQAADPPGVPRKMSSLEMEVLSKSSSLIATPSPSTPENSFGSTTTPYEQAESLAWLSTLRGMDSESLSRWSKGDTVQAVFSLHLNTTVHGPRQVAKFVERLEAVLQLAYGDDAVYLHFQGIEPGADG